ncbi:MAG: relaxase/mobilization nuclease domain-containing protein [Flavobacteriales bacterium]|nr:relaxase/mobilization nuclease domain-containing protein [Flavobacteriales bacterium]
MIIKVIQLKSYNAISNVVNYIASDDGRIKDHHEQGIFHNLNRTDQRSIATQLQTNFANHASNRIKNKAKHVILSVNPIDRDKVTMEIMDDLSRHYIETAFPKAIVFGCHHMKQDHRHSHLIISGNELMSKTSTRQTKGQLRAVQQEMILYMQEHHPELTIGIDMSNYGKRLHSEKAYYKQKRNPLLTLTKDELAMTVQRLFRLSGNTKEFKQQLEEMGLRTYDHGGKLMGVYFGEDEKKMRFSRLRIGKEQFEQLDIQNDRLKQLEQLREDNDDREMDIER